MSKNIKVQVSVLESNDMGSLNNIVNTDEAIIENGDLNSDNIKINDIPDYNKFAEFLNNCLENSSIKDMYKLPESCSFDPDNAFIECRDKEYQLSKKESVFLTILFDKRKIVSYEEMKNNLWSKPDSVTLNSLRIFVKNIKKKLPENTIINIQGLGYKLSL